MRVVVGARSDVGRVREGNEDALLVQEPLFVVADGMGGHLAGDVASATAIEVIEDRTGNGTRVDPSALARFVKDANLAIWQKANAESELRGMGTTCTLLFIDGDTGHLAHVGDSRAYLLRGDRLSQLTEDHTLVARMVQEGRLQPEEAQHHPQRSIITRALGVEDDVEVDVGHIDLEAGDRILLCSDGLSSMLEEEAIRHILSDGSDPQTIADQLVEAANDAGGEDNITVVVLDVTDGDGRAAGTRQDTERDAPATDVVGPPIEDAEETANEEPPARGGGVGPVGRWLIGGGVALAIILLAGVAAARYTVSNAWFVGADDEGVLTIYRGIPERVLGFDLKEPREESRLTVNDLPEFLRDDVEEGIKVASLAAARRTMANLEERSRDLGDRTEREGDG